MAYYTRPLLSLALKLFLVSKNPDKTVRVPELDPWLSDPPQNEKAGDRGWAQSQTAFLMDWFRMQAVWALLALGLPWESKLPYGGQRPHTDTSSTPSFPFA